VIDEFAKAYLHDNLRWVREGLLSKLDGLSEYDVRRPLTVTGTNLLGLVKHLAITEARYFSEVFDRPAPEPLPPWDSDDAWSSSDMWVTEHESRPGVLERYRRACASSDATIDALPVDAPGHVPWWPHPDVKLFNVMVHLLNETNRHAGHADILREQLDGVVGAGAQSTVLHGHNPDYWEGLRAEIEQAARASDR
jgi:uncharacterized damage-inducible protein DinB